MAYRAIESEARVTVTEACNKPASGEAGEPVDGLQLYLSRSRRATGGPKKRMATLRRSWVL